MVRGSQVRFQSTKSTFSSHLSPKHFLFPAIVRQKYRIEHMLFPVDPSDRRILGGAWRRHGWWRSDGGRRDSLPDVTDLASSLYSYKEYKHAEEQAHPWVASTKKKFRRPSLTRGKIKEHGRWAEVN
jgi:hypothetical protein